MKRIIHNQKFNLVKCFINIARILTFLPVFIVMKYRNNDDYDSLFMVCYALSSDVVIKI